MRKLYEIRTDIADSIEFMISGEEEVENPPPPLEDLDIEAEEKIKNCVLAINSLKGDVAEAKPMLETILAYIKKREDAVSKIEDDIRLTMEVMLIDKIDDPICKVSLGKASQVVKINEKEIPQEYKKLVPESYKPFTKTEYKKLITSGKEIPGVELVDGKRKLTYPKFKQ